ncbi:hypothetical protein BSBH6_04176 [Bacillus subtilis]|nr:hypothetical protein BSBH6_04176 [Bacillus subtilis]RPK19824.1 hypothetical protein BH5_04177 [Bacillus subtilis]
MQKNPFLCFLLKKRFVIFILFKKAPDRFFNDQVPSYLSFSLLLS